MKPLIFLLLNTTIMCTVLGRPQVYIGSETASEAQDALTRSFSVVKNPENLKLPSLETDLSRPYTHPYNFNLTNDGSGNYFFSFDVFNGHKRSEIGELKNAGTENEIQSVRGQYVDVYYANDNSVITRTIGYVADENGYRPFLINVSVNKFGGALAGGALAGGGIAGGHAAPGAPKSETGIASAAQASLIGGGLGK